MSDKNNIEDSYFPEKENAFKVPEGYFEQLPDKLLSRIREAEKTNQSEGTFQFRSERRIALRPYISLAASISGLALIIYLVLQSIMGSQLNDTSYSDLEILEEAGILSDEIVIAETYALNSEDSYSDWEEDAMSYLASNEVDLIHLLENN
jgi:hypothetical protein